MTDNEMIMVLDMIEKRIQEKRDELLSSSYGDKFSLGERSGLMKASNLVFFMKEAIKGNEIFWGFPEISEIKERKN